MERRKLSGHVVVDTSVLIKWFSDEQQTSRALELREGHVRAAIRIVCPDLALYEIANALRYNKKLSSLDIAQATDSLFSIGISILVPTQQVLREAVTHALRYNITVYDAYFLALTKELGTEYVTADEKLFRSTKGESFVRLLGDLP